MPRFALLFAALLVIGGLGYRHCGPSRRPITPHTADHTDLRKLGFVEHPDGQHDYSRLPIIYGYGGGYTEACEGQAVQGGCFIDLHGRTAVVCAEHRVWKGLQEGSEFWQHLPEHFGSRTNESESNKPMQTDGPTGRR